MSSMRKFLGLLLLCAMSTPLLAQKMTMGYIYPAGGRRGDSVDVVLAGLNLQKATEVILSGSGIQGRVVGPCVAPVEKSAKGENKKGNKKAQKKNKLNDQSSPQLADRIVVRVHIDAKAPIGMRDLRVKSPQGVSNKLFFEVSPYKNQVNTFDEFKRGDTLLVKRQPVVLCGQVPPGAVNRYRLDLEAETDYVVSVKARNLLPYIADAVPGWFQAVVRITDAYGREIAYCDDSGISPDPEFSFRTNRKGVYYLSIHDAIYRGREDFGYRITLGKIPFVTRVTPAVAVAGKKTTFALEGVNLPNKQVVLTPSLHKAPVVHTKKKGTAPFQIHLAVLPPQTKLQKYPRQAGVATSLSSVYCDSITQPYEVHTYPIRLVRGASFVANVRARRLTSMGDFQLQLYDASGKQVAQSDDQEDAMQGMMTFHADPQLSYQATASGVYELRVSELLGRSGATCYYVLDFPEKRQDFQAFVSPSTLSIPSGGTAILKFDFVSEQRKNPKGKIVFKGLPQGYRVSDTSLPATSKLMEVSITAPKGAPVSKLPIAPVLVLDSGEEIPIVSVDGMMQAFYYTHRLPAAEFSTQVVDAAPFSVSVVSAPAIQITPASKGITFRVRIDRDPGFDMPIELGLNKKVKWLDPNPIVFAPNEEEKEVFIPFVNGTWDNKIRFVQLSTHFDAIVKGEIQKQGKRVFQNALYSEVSPVVTISYKQPKNAKMMTKKKPNGPAKGKKNNQSKQK